MSQAGKFIPGGSGRKSTPIEGPSPIRGPGGEPPPKKGGKRGSARTAGLTKPVPDNRKLPILIMSSFVCCLLVSVAWYQLGVLPSRRALAAEQQRAALSEKQLAASLAAQQASEKANLTHDAVATVVINSTPAGSATVGDVTKPTPATFDHVTPGPVTVTVHADGYEDFHRDLTVSASKPTDLGTVQLAPNVGDLTLSSPQKEVHYAITGPNNYTHEGQLPDKLEHLPAGTYQITARQNDWQLPPLTITLQDRDNLQQEIKFPFASLSIDTVPPGATVRNGNVVLGQTPLALSQVHPGDMELSIDLPPYTLQRLALSLPESGTISKQITLKTGKDFIAACGMPMVYLPDGYWVGKYEVTQRVFESIAGFNPSTFHRPNHPVETVSWEQAMSFCEKLNAEEQRAGKLPHGYHYTLPNESQWDAFTADASLDQAATSRTNTRSSTEDVGASEPNKYGLYDTIGNVWEWCLDSVDEKGTHTLRGGSWLSSAANFPNAETRSAGVAKYADRFTGFRVVLVPN